MDCIWGNLVSVLRLIIVYLWKRPFTNELEVNGLCWSAGQMGSENRSAEIGKPFSE